MAYQLQIVELLKFIAILTVILAAFSVGTHAIFCPNDAIDSAGFTRIFTQGWMQLFGNSGLEDFQSKTANRWFHFSYRTAANVACYSSVFFNNN